jgi:hypothetical protein
MQLFTRFYGTRIMHVDTMIFYRSFIIIWYFVCTHDSSSQFRLILTFYYEKGFRKFEVSHGPPRREKIVQYRGVPWSTSEFSQFRP